MMKTKVKTAALPAGLPAKLYLAAAAIVLALLAIPHIGHAQASCAARGKVPTRATGSPGRSVVWSAVRSEPVSAARWGPSRACLASRTAAIAAAAITTATIASTAIDNFRLLLA